MKVFLLVLLATFWFQNAVFAQQNDRRQEKIEKIRSRALDSIAEHRTILDRFENCIRSANSREAVRTCRDKNRAASKRLMESKKFRGK